MLPGFQAEGVIHNGVLIPSWLHLIMPPMRVAAQWTFDMQLLLLNIVCGYQSLLFDSDSEGIRGLDPVKTRID